MSSNTESAPSKEKRSDAPKASTDPDAVVDASPSHTDDEDETSPAVQEAKRVTPTPASTPYSSDNEEEGELTVAFPATQAPEPAASQGDDDDSLPASQVVVTTLAPPGGKISKLNSEGKLVLPRDSESESSSDAESESDASSKAESESEGEAESSVRGIPPPHGGGKLRLGRSVSGANDKADKVVSEPPTPAPKVVSAPTTPAPKEVSVAVAPAAPTKPKRLSPIIEEDEDDDVVPSSQVELERELFPLVEPVAKKASAVVEPVAKKASAVVEPVAKKASAVVVPPVTVVKKVRVSMTPPTPEAKTTEAKVAPDAPTKAPRPASDDMPPPPPRMPALGASSEVTAASETETSKSTNPSQFASFIVVEDDYDDEDFEVDEEEAAADARARAKDHEDAAAYAYAYAKADRKEKEKENERKEKARKRAADARAAKIREKEEKRAAAAQRRLDEAASLAEEARIRQKHKELRAAEDAEYEARIRAEQEEKRAAEEKLVADKERRKAARIEAAATKAKATEEAEAQRASDAKAKEAAPRAAAAKVDAEAQGTAAKPKVDTPEAKKAGEPRPAVASKSSWLSDSDDDVVEVVERPLKRAVPETGVTTSNPKASKQARVEGTRVTPRLALYSSSSSSSSSSAVKRPAPTDESPVAAKCARVEPAVVQPTQTLAVRVEPTAVQPTQTPAVRVEPAAVPQPQTLAMRLEREERSPYVKVEKFSDILVDGVMGHLSHVAPHHREHLDAILQHASDLMEEIIKDDADVVRCRVTRDLTKALVGTYGAIWRTTSTTQRLTGEMDARADIYTSRVCTLNAAIHGYRTERVRKQASMDALIKSYHTALTAASGYVRKNFSTANKLERRARRIKETPPKEDPIGAPHRDNEMVMTSTTIPRSVVKHAIACANKEAIRNGEEPLDSCPACERNFMRAFPTTLVCGHRVCHSCMRESRRSGIADGAHALACPIDGCDQDTPIHSVPPLDFNLRVALNEIVRKHRKTCKKCATVKALTNEEIDAIKVADAAYWAVMEPVAPRRIKKSRATESSSESESDSDDESTDTDSDVEKQPQPKRRRAVIEDDEGDESEEEEEESEDLTSISGSDSEGSE